jgi:glycerol uptake facilitator-like aquaporin
MLPLVAEFLGTFALLTAIFFTGNWLIIGLTLAVVVWAIGGISGGHVNPAVTLAMYLKGGFSGTKVISYYAAQFLGAAAAYYTYKILA